MPDPTAHYPLGEVVPGVVRTEVTFLTAAPAATFTITDTRAKTGSVIIAQLSYSPATSKSLDELDMDNILVSAGASGTGSFSINVRSADGSTLAGAFPISYSIN